MMETPYLDRIRIMGLNRTFLRLGHSLQHHSKSDIEVLGGGFVPWVKRDREMQGIACGSAPGVFHTLLVSNNAPGMNRTKYKSER